MRKIRFSTYMLIKRRPYEMVPLQLNSVTVNPFSNIQSNTVSARLTFQRRILMPPPVFMRKLRHFRARPVTQSSNKCTKLTFVREGISIGLIFRRVLNSIRISTPVIQRHVHRVGNISEQQQDHRARTQVVHRRHRCVPRVVLKSRHILRRLMNRSFNLNPLVPILLILPKLLIIHRASSVVFSARGSIFHSSRRHQRIAATILRQSRVSHVDRTALVRYLTSIISFQLVHHSMRINILERVNGVSRHLIRRIRRVSIMSRHQARQDVPILAEVSNANQRRMIRVRNFYSVHGVMYQRCHIPCRVNIMVNVPTRVLRRFRAKLANNLIRVMLMFGRRKALLRRQTSIITGRKGQIMRRQVHQAQPMLIVISV